MTGFRLESGGIIDRQTPITFQFDGRKQSGYAGDTIASALMASGHKIVGRSFKFHRPRGISSAGVEESGALFNVGKGATRIPNVKGTMAEIYEGMPVFGQNAFPSVRFDIGAVNDVLGPFFSAGFYYKTFMGPFRNTAMWMQFERIIRRAAGTGTASREADPATYDIANGFCDLLIIGGGHAGLVAAAEAAEAGMDVLLVEQDFVLGGQLLAQAGGMAIRDSLVARIQSAGGRIMLRATAFGLYDGLVVGVVERGTDHLATPHPALPRETFHIIRPERILMATGAYERGIAFGDNDRPGVMQAGAISTYLHRYGVAAGQNIVLATTHDGVYGQAAQMVESGLSVTILDTRHQHTPAQSEAEDAGIEILRGMAPVRAIGLMGIAGVEVAERASDGAISPDSKIIGADILGVSGGFNPVVNLLSHRGVKPVWNQDIQGFLSGDSDMPLVFAGSAAGYYQEADCALSAIEALSQVTGKISKSLLKSSKAKKTFKSGQNSKPGAKAEIGLEAGFDAVFEIKPDGRKLKSFIDPQHDVKTSDIRQAQSEGFISVEHMKRYTTLGMASDQGRVGNVLGIATMAEALGQGIADTGITTFRPPFTPTSIGVLAGRSRGDEWMPKRLTPIQDVHIEAGAVMTDAGLWKRPWYYPLDGEDINDAYIREATKTRQSVGMVDVSTLGKIQLQGPDTAEFLNRIYVNGFAKLPVGKARYGIMLRDDGAVLDDGTTWRLAEDDYFMTTTTAQAAPVMSFIEDLLQTRWPDLKVHATSVTDAWAGIAVAGPRARSVLAKACPNMDYNDDAFPFMGVREGMIALPGGEVPCRAARISFSGEMAWEIYVSAGYGAAAWKLLAALVSEAGGVPYGMEALGALRIEKGHVTAAELDGRTTLEDAGFGGMASKTKPYIGSVLRQRPALQDEKRARLVGIMPKNRDDTFQAGSLLCAKDHQEGFGDGWVTAVTFSPALGHWIGLGFVSGGHEAWQGRPLVSADPVRNKTVEVEVVSPHMFDPKGERMHG